MGRRARSWHKVLSSQHGGAGGAVFKVSRGSPAPLLQARGAIEARRKRSHWRDPEVPRTDPLLRLSLLPSVGRLRSWSDVPGCRRAGRLRAGGQLTDRKNGPRRIGQDGAPGGRACPRQTRLGARQRCEGAPRRRDRSRPHRPPRHTLADTGMRGGWEVVRVRLLAGLRIDPLTETAEAEPRLPEASDPRPASIRNIGAPYGAWPATGTPDTARTSVPGCPASPDTPAEPQRAAAQGVPWRCATRGPVHRCPPRMLNRRDGSTGRQSSAPRIADGLGCSGWGRGGDHSPHDGFVHRGWVTAIALEVTCRPRGSCRRDEPRGFQVMAWAARPRRGPCAPARR
jgi:hypothetical protein